MKNILLFCSLFLTELAAGQTAQFSSASANAASVDGTILLSPIQSLRVERTNNFPIEFLNANDYNNASGKQYNNYLTLYVTSTVPWMITVRAVSESFVDKTTPSLSIPVSIMKLCARNNTTQFNPLTTSASVQTLLYATDNAIHSTHFVDINLNPGWKYSGGNYSTTLLFTLTSQ